jgi:hypothetical protein
VALTATGLSSPRTAGATGTVTVTARDAHGNVATAYAGTVAFTSSDPSAALPAEYTFTSSDAGAHKFTGISLQTAGTQSVSVADVLNPALTWSQSVVVNPGAAKTLVVSGLSSPRVAGATGTLSVTAQDAYGNVVTSYTGTVDFTSSDASAVLPADYTFTSSDAGSHSFAVTLVTAGTQWVRARDTAKPSITGRQTGIEVQSGVFIAGTVTGPGGSPLAGIAVEANSGFGSTWASTAADGTYSVTVAPGSYIVSFHDNTSTYVNGCYTGSGFSADPYDCTGVSVTTAPVSGVDVQMPLGLHITGTVTGPGGMPLAGISVGTSNIAINDGPPTIEAFSTVTTTAEGAYSLAVLPGTYDVMFDDNAATYVDGCYSASGFTADQNACSALILTTSDVSGVDAQMPLGVQISGTVSGPGGTPLAGIDVQARGNASTWATTRTDGTYSFALAPGEYELFFQDNSGTYVDGCYSTSGFTPAEYFCPTVSVTTSLTGLDIALPRGLQISGTVTGPHGAPAANVWVQDGTTLWGSTRPDGTYSLAVLPGSYTLDFSRQNANYADTYIFGCYSASGFSPEQNCTPVSVTTSAVSGIDVQMMSGPQLSGTVTGPDGAPVPNLLVSASAGGWTYWANTAADGTYSLAVLPGSYTVQFYGGVGGCYSSSGLNTDGNCTPVSVTTSGVTGVDVQMPLGLQISGKVTGPGGVPLADIWVSANSSNFSGGTNTASDGTYSLTVLPDSSYTVSFSDSSGSHVGGCYSSTGFDADQGACTAVAVATSDVNGIDVTMPLALKISGTVTGPKGTPLANINVNAQAGSFNAGASTGPDGTYSLTVPAGSYTVWFNDPNANYVSGCYSSSGFTTDQGTCTAVVVTTSDVGGVDVTIPKGLKISGTVTGPDGTQLANIWVSANASNFNGWTGTSTAADGTYSLAVPAGSYTVSFNDFSGQYASGCYSSSGFSSGQSACTPVVVTNSDVGGVDVTMPLALHITGTVTGSGGVPLAGIHVFVNAYRDNFLTWASTAADGTYSLAVPPGSYTVGFDEPNSNYVGGCYDSSSSSGFSDQNACTPVDVTTSDVRGIDVTMSTGPKITGTVTGPDGVPLANIYVFTNSDWAWTWTVTGTDGTYAIAVPPGSYTVSFNDPSGYYPGGCYDSSSSSGFSDQGACTPVNVTNQDVGGVDVTMPTVLHITGTVTGPDGTQLANIWVSANAGDFNVGASTGPDGTYSLAVPAGSYTVSFNDPSDNYVNGCYSSSGFTTDQGDCTPVDVTTSDVGGIDVQMPLALYITGTVTGSDGSPLAGIHVIALDQAAGNFLTWTSTATDGTYTLAVPPGSYTLGFNEPNSDYVGGCYSSSGFTTDQGACSPVDVTTSDVGGIDVQIPTGLKISGTVTGPSGTPLADIELTTNWEWPWTWTVTGSDGTYSLAVPAGSYTVTIYDPSGTYVGGCYDSSSSSGFSDQGACTPVSVTNQDVSGIDVTMPLALHITGTVTGPDGAPLANISVGAQEGNYNANASTGSDGTYSLAVPAGSYTVWFNDPNANYVRGCYSSSSSSGFTTDQGACASVDVTTSGVSGVDVTMPLGLKISGTVTGPSGTPLADINVGAHAPNFNAGMTTAADGTYSFAVLPGSYTVSFNDPNNQYLSGCYLSSSSSGFTTDQSVCTPVDVTTSGVSGVDVTMPAALHITGTVTGPDGAPLANINIGANAGNFNVGASTGPDGTYSLAVPAGSYTVWFNDPNGNYVSGCYSSSSSSGFNDQNACTSVVVTSSDVGGINVTMPAGLKISGTVTGLDGAPLANISVNAQGPGNFNAGTSTASDGTYSLVVPSGDSYTVSFIAFGTSYSSSSYSGPYSGCYSIAGFTTDQAACSAVSVTTSSMNGVDVQMPLLLITGTVTGPDGSPLAGINAGANAGNFNAGTSTAPDGTYSMLVTPGSYTVFFNDPSGNYVNGCYSSSSYSPGQTDCTAVVVSTSDVGGVDVQMPAGLKVSGTVTGPDDAPLANIHVNANAGDFNTWATTATDGTYSLAVPPGSYTVSFNDFSGNYVGGCYDSSSSSGFSAGGNDCTAVDVTTSGVSGIDVQMPAGLKISGTVTEPGDAPLANINVGVSAQGSNFGAGTSTAADGTYSLTVVAGSYTVWFNDPSGNYVGGCYDSSSSSGFSAGGDDCTAVDVTTSGVSGIDVQMPAA